jgi:hypothetical protein
MLQEAFTVHQAVQGGRLFLDGPPQRDPNICLAKIRRKLNFRYRRAAHSRVRHLIPDELLQFLSDRFGKPLSAMGVQSSEYNGATALLEKLVHNGLAGRATSPESLHRLTARRRPVRSSGDLLSLVARHNLVHLILHPQFLLLQALLLGFIF